MCIEEPRLVVRLVSIYQERESIQTTYERHAKVESKFAEMRFNAKEVKVMQLENHAMIGRYKGRHGTSSKQVTGRAGRAEVLAARGEQVKVLRV